MTKITHQFDLIENISPSENWDSAFQNKLNMARMSKSSTITQFNAMILMLLLVNIGFIWNSLKTENTKTVISRKDTCKIISEELLIQNN